MISGKTTRSKVTSTTAGNRKPAAKFRPTTAVVGPKGEIVIPASLRKRYAMKEGATVVFQEDRGRLKLALANFDAILALGGSLPDLPLEEDLEGERQAARAREDLR